MAVKPRLFIGCAVERLRIAYAMQKNLDHDMHVTVWPQGIFAPSRSSVESLCLSLGNFDAAAFIFSPEDVATIRDNTQTVPRDNVVFELGLFVGRLGREKCFIVRPRCTDMHLPTDLVGMTPVDYDPDRIEDNPQAALGSACFEIAEALRRRARVTFDPDACSFIGKQLALGGNAWGGQCVLVFWAADRGSSPEARRFWCCASPVPITDGTWRTSFPLVSPVSFRNVVAALCSQDAARKVIAAMKDNALTTRDALVKEFGGDVIAWSDLVRIEKTV